MRVKRTFVAVAMASGLAAGRSVATCASVPDKAGTTGEERHR